MSRGLNKVQIIGRLGGEPDIRSTNNGASVANISVATSEVWIDRETQERNEQTEWHRVVFFGKLADVIRQYLGKGDQVYVEGKLRTRKWQDQNGNDRYTTEILGNDMQMLGGSSSRGSAPRTEGSGGGGGPASSPQSTPEPVADTGGLDGIDDPF